MNQIKFGSIISILNLLLNIFAGLIITRLMVIKLGTSEYGVYILVASLVSYVSIFDFGLHQTIFRFISKFRAQKSSNLQSIFLATILLIYLLITILIVIVGFFFYFNIDTILSDNFSVFEIQVAKNLIPIHFLNLIFSLVLGSFQFVLNGYGLFIISYSINFIKSLLRHLFFILFLFIGFKSFNLSLVDLSLSITIGLIYTFYVFFSLKISINFTYLKIQNFIEVISFSLYGFLISIVNQFFWNFSQLILALLAKPTEIVFYSISTTFVIYFQLISLTLSGFFLPRISIMVHAGSSSKDYTDLLIKVGRFQLSMLGLFLIGFIFLGKPFIILWLGNEFQNVYYIILIIIIPLTIPMIQTTSEDIIKAKNLQAFKTLLYIFMVLFNAFLSIFLYTFLGSFAIAISTSISIVLFQCLIMNIYYSKKLGINILRFFKQVFKGILGSFLITIFFSLITLLFPTNTFLIFIIKAFFITSVYLVCFLLLGFNGFEKTTLKSLFKLK